MNDRINSTVSISSFVLLPDRCRFLASRVAVGLAVAAVAWCGTVRAAEPWSDEFSLLWSGRLVFEDERPFPAGVSFVPGAHYRTEVTSLPAELRIEDGAGKILTRFAAPTNVAPPFTLHLAVTGRHAPALFTTKDGQTRLAYVVKRPCGIDLRRREYLASASVRAGGGAGKVTSALSPGVGQADVRFVTSGRSGALYFEDGRLFFTFSARFFGSVCGVGSLDPRHPEKGVRFEGVILFDYGDGLVRNDLATHVFYDGETRTWRGWSSNFSTSGDDLGKRAKGGINAVWSDTSPLHGLSFMKAKTLDLDGMNEDPSGIWDAEAGKWRLFLSTFTPKGIRARMLESDRWDGGFRPLTKTVSEDSTGTTIACLDGRRYCLSGSLDRAYYVYAYPTLEKLGKFKISPPPWGRAKGWPHGRGWPAFAALPEGMPYRRLLFTMDRVNFPGMPKPNWTYGRLFLYGASETCAGDVVSRGADGR